MTVYLVHFPGDGLVGALIRLQSRGRYGHTAIVAGGWLFESHAGSGVVQRGVTEHDLRQDWTAVELPDSDAALEFLCDQVGKPYDYLMVARFITRRQETRSTTGRWFCSELVYAACKAGGVDLFRETAPWEVSPALIARSPLQH